MPSIEELLTRRDAVLGPAYRLFYERPLHIVKGEGVWLTGADGERYLDAYNNVPHVGHCHPKVVEAVCRQAATLNTHTRYLHETVLGYAEMLVARCPDGLNTAMFCCTGTEANELALRLARAHTGAGGLVVMPHAYHGNSWAVSQITTSDTPPEMRGDHVITVPAPDPYAGPYRDGDAAERYAAHVQEAIAALAQRGHRPAAFMVDTVFSSEGIPRVPESYLRRAVDTVRAAGGLFVADEVQAGFGRTGSNFWGFANHGVEPDIITMGKPMGNGHPVAAVVARRAVAESFSRQADYFNTFGGNPVSAAAAQAVLEVMEEEGLQANAETVGAYLRGGLRGLAERFELIGDVRGPGLFIGVELVRDRDTREPAAREAARVVNGLRERGVLISSTGPRGNVLKIRPPMPFATEHAELLLDRLDDTLASLGPS